MSKELIFAVVNKNLDEVRKIVENSDNQIDLNFVDISQETGKATSALIEAVRKGKLSLVRYLLEKGALVEGKEPSLEKQTEVFKTYLYNDTKYKRPEIFVLLLQHSRSFDIETFNSFIAGEILDYHRTSYSRTGIHPSETILLLLELILRNTCLLLGEIEKLHFFKEHLSLCFTKDIFERYLEGRKITFQQASKAKASIKYLSDRKFLPMELSSSLDIIVDRASQISHFTSLSHQNEQLSQQVSQLQEQLVEMRKQMNEQTAMLMQLQQMFLGNEKMSNQTRNTSVLRGGIWK